MVIKKEDIDFKYNVKEYISFLKKYKGLFALLLVIILFIQIGYTIDKFLFRIIIDDGTDFTNGLISKEIFVKTLIILAIIFLSALAIRVVLKWVQIHLINLLDADMIVDIKRKYFNHILGLSYNFHTTHKTGSLISRLIRGSRAIEAMTDVIAFNFAPLSIQLVVVSGSLLYFDWVPALVVLITSIVFVGYSFIIQQKQRVINVAVNNAEDLEKAYVSDFFTNIDAIKLFGRENSIKTRISKAYKEVKEKNLKHWNYFRWMDSGHSLILAIGTFFLVYFPLMSFLDGKTTLGTLTFIYTIYGNLIFPLFNFVHGLRNYYRAMADFESLFSYGKIKNEIKNKVDAKGLKIKKGEIEFKNVNFSYHSKKFLDNFNLKIPSNKKIALIGHSGCGKTTLIKLIYRLYDVNSGEILIDGKNISDLKKESLRSELSIVPQECVLFDDTIYNNIAFSRPSASKEEVMKAMKFAQLDKVVASFPDKEKTIVGERGVKLSGGEKQRVSIARAILADKKILVLDEATSALDSKTEHDIQRDLEKLMEGRTSIIIAHRLSTIMKADIIVVMKKGEIVQIGNHMNLINKEGTYKNLWNLQKGGYIK